MGSTKVEKCRVCGAQAFVPVFDFGEQVIANHFHKAGDPESPPLPLNLVRCGKCSLVQLADITEPDLMYRNYWYRSGVNQSMRNHLFDLAERIDHNFVEIGAEDTIVDIGCNDGTFLNLFSMAGRRIGIDPSNIVPLVPCEYVNDYFTYETANRILQGKKAKLVTSIAMFYDLNDPVSFVNDVRSVLADDGLWVAELSYLPIMMGNTAYDSVCHEHVCYYRMETFLRALRGTDLVVVHAEVNQMNGGSFRVFVAPNGDPDESMTRLVQEEISDGYREAKPYKKFAQGVEKSSGTLVDFLNGQKGKTVYGYGASTKGQVIMQYCRIGPDQIKAIAERNPLKYGLLTPGTNVPICSEEEMRNAKPDFLVVFPWYFLDEFKGREKALLDAGTKLVVPLPSFSVL